MNAADIMKVVLIAAVVLLLLKMAAGGWGGQAAPAPRPFDGEWYGDADGDAEGYGDADDDAEGYDDDDDAEGYDADDDAEGYDDEAEVDAAYATAAPRSADNRPFATSADLLPKPQPGTGGFAEFAPKALKAQNFLDCTRFVGVNTQGSSLRNANHDLRSVPVIPRQAVGPWSQSTIEADLLRKPLE